MRLLVDIDVDDLASGVAFYAGGRGLRLERLLFDGSVAEMIGSAHVGSAPLARAPWGGERRVARATTPVTTRRWLPRFTPQH